MKANGSILVAYLKAQNNAIQEWPSANDKKNIDILKWNNI